MVNALIFLGAGASAPFGVPTMKEMVPAFEEYLNKLPSDVPFRYQMPQLYKSIKEVLASAYGYVDLESVFSVIDAIGTGTKYSDLGFTASFAISRLRPNISKDSISNRDEQKTANNLLEHFKKFIRSKCTIDDSKFSQVDSVYRSFFEELGKKFKVGYTVGADGNHYYATDWTIYTTNYDTCIESFWEGVADINDLFNEHGGVKVLAVDRVTEPGKPKIVKLHGSVDWYKLSTWKIVKTASQRARVGREPVRGEQMLYPVQQKDLYLYPWLGLVSGFKQDLQKMTNWIVIGYSFNDEFILNIFKELPSVDSRYNLIIVDPNAIQIVSTKFQDYSGRVKTVSWKFELQYALRAIVEKLP